MLPIPKLYTGFSDAENYLRRGNKEVFNKIFLRTNSLQKLIGNDSFFLLGDKGAGKTAYAVYLANNNVQDTRAEISYIRETEYRAFMALRAAQHLTLSDYIDIWRVLLMVLLAKQLKEADILNANVISKMLKFRAINAAINEFYDGAFAPEIANVMSFVTESEVSSALITKHAQVGAKGKQKQSRRSSTFQTNLLKLRQQFEEAIAALKLSKNYILFIDGIDIRPNSVPYGEYLECIKGLANAVWALNNDYFPSIKDSHGRLKVVLLIRPDIFSALGLQNQNTKLRDNSVFLDWRTTYEYHRKSELFHLSDRLLSFQQDQPYSNGECWDYYFPNWMQNVTNENPADTSFVSFLRFSFWRPRDIVTMLDLLKQRFIAEGRGNDEVFRKRDFDDPVFRRDYAAYLLAEIKDHLAFYYSDPEYEVFLKFFEYLKGKKAFTYNEMLSAYYDFYKFLTKNNKVIPSFATSPDELLQFLYDLGVICYIEVQQGYSPRRWCFRERTYANMYPKVKTHLEYEIHHGLSKALNVGTEMRPHSPGTRGSRRR